MLIKTKRLTALPLDRRDAQELFAMHQNPAAMAHLGGVKSESEANEWLNENLEHWERRGFGLWIFRDRCDGHFVGRGGLREVQVDRGKEIELAYALLDQYWGVGFAAEMATEILKMGFDRHQLQSIVALIAADNIRSRRVAEKLGFRFERIVTFKGLPTMMYRLQNRDWKLQ